MRGMHLVKVSCFEIAGGVYAASVLQVSGAWFRSSSINGVCREGFNSEAGAACRLP